MKEGVLTTVIDLRLPTKITRGLEMTDKQKKLSDFLAEVDKQNERHAVPETGRLHATQWFEFGTVHENYILERIGTNESTKGYGISYGMNMTAPTIQKIVDKEGNPAVDKKGELVKDTNKVTLWISGNMKKDLDKFLSLEDVTDNLPAKISFAKSKDTNPATGNVYHKLNLKLVATGDDVQFELDAL